MTLFCLPNQSQSDRRFLDTLFRDLDALSVSDLVEFLHNVPQPARVSRNGKPGRSACTAADRLQWHGGSDIAARVERTHDPTLS